jgi:TonB family protein
VLAVTLAGFRALRHEFELREAQDWDRAVTLQVAELRETITVRASRLAAPRPPVQSRGGPQPIRVGGNIRVPLKLVDVRPIYPAAMREAGRTGVVPIEAIIGRDGSVSSVRVLSAHVHPDFAIAAVDAVRQWRFSPTMLNGVAVEVVMTVSVRFDLSD